MIICIDYNDDGFWLAWDKEKGFNAFPRLNVCRNLHRLYTIVRTEYPNAEIELSDAGEIVLNFPDSYVGSSLYNYDKNRTPKA